MYVAGLDRGDLPIGDWSIDIKRFTYSRPSMEENLSNFALESFSLAESPSFTTSFTRELLPLPLTPVTQTTQPSGILTSIFFKLWWRIPLIVKKCSNVAPLFREISMLDSPVKYFAVKLFLNLAVCSSSTNPHATTSPPCAPGPGPKSTI